VYGLSKRKGPNIRDGSSSEKGRATKRKRRDSENKRLAKIRIVSPTTVNEPSMEEGPNVKDGSSSKKGMPTRKKNSATEKKGPLRIG
jgi:hypothetical protein